MTNMTKPSNSSNWVLVCACNDERILKNTLLKSPDLEAGNLILQKGYATAGKAYNAALDISSHAEILIFCHQDVFLPAGWLADLQHAIAQMQDIDANWGILGVYGETHTDGGKGWLYSTGLQRFLGEPFRQPQEVQSLDEVVLVLRRSSGIRFDEQLPGFHLYGADICTEAYRNRMKSYVFSAFCIHNAKGIPFLPLSYWRSLLYFRKKWQAYLPIHTPCMRVTHWGFPVWRYLLKRPFDLAFGKKRAGRRCEDPENLYARLCDDPRLNSRKCLARLSSTVD